MPERFDPAVFADPTRCPITGRTLLVAAHPDDETIGCGAQLHRCEDLILLHLTDGAPRDLADARRHGFEDAPSYAAARARELQAALAAGGVSCRRYALGLADQSLAHGLAELARRIRAAIERLRPALLLTHAYEGGHPDHDAAAFACQAAADALPQADRPLRLEFAGYHATQAGLTWGRFLPGEEEFAVALTEAERRRKDTMLACFATQAAVLAAAPRDHERLRLAPRYDFNRAPHPGPLWYERMNWGATGAEWRAAAQSAHSAC
jgi:LmbE family N-acetylglucosaminyl deacetylase